MPYPLFDYTPESVIHTMGSCSGKGNGSKGPKRSGTYQVGDYTYRCEQETTCQNGKPQNKGEPNNCCWSGRANPGTYQSMNKPKGWGARSC